MPKLAAGVVGVVEGVNRGQAIVEHVDQADHAQQLVAELDQPRIDAALRRNWAYCSWLSSSMPPPRWRDRGLHRVVVFIDE